MLERNDSNLTLAEQAALISVSRSSLYYMPRAPSEWEVRVKHSIDAIYTMYPFYGSRRIQHSLGLDDIFIGRDLVRRYMREMGLAAIYPKSNLSKSAPENKLYPYIIRNVTPNYPNHIWGIDITYIRLKSNWMYLVTVLDWYSRYIVSWELSESLEMPFVVSCVSRALSLATPYYFNSDQVSHFTSPKYIDLLLAQGVHISMNGRGRAIDNIFTERLWRTIKYENVYLNDYASPREARNGISSYLKFYNERRIHQSLDYRCPADVYQTERPVDLMISG